MGDHRVRLTEDPTADLYDRLRDQVEHENNIYNQRIVWLITMQAFLYATLGLLMQAKINADSANKAHYINQIDQFILLISAVGIFVALISDKILGDARSALHHMAALWDAHLETVPEAERKYYPHVRGGDGKPTRRVLLRSRNLPFVFVLAWTAAALILFWERLAWIEPIVARAVESIWHSVASAI